MSYLDLIAEDRQLIVYRPRLNEVTGSVTATILLQQILFRWNQNGKRPFYKFNGPCDHKRYVSGQSWQEELGFTYSELNTARDKIAKKVLKGQNKVLALRENMVIFYTDANRVTWYEVNEKLIEQSLISIYQISKSLITKVNQDSLITKVNQDSQITFLTEKNKEEKGKEEGGSLSFIWESVLTELENQMTKATFNTWLAQSQLVSIEQKDDGTHLAVIEVHNSYAADWVNGRLKEMIKRTLDAITDMNHEVYARAAMLHQNGVPHE